MRRESRKPNCTNSQWVGRAHCADCPVRHLMLFSGLPEDAFDPTVQPIDHFLFSPGAVLHEMGSDGEHIFSIRRGLVKLLQLVPGGSWRIVRLLGPGTSVGLEMLDGKGSDSGEGYRHTVMAVNEVDACRIPLATIRQLMREYPQLCDQVRQRLQDQLDRADRWIVALGTGPAKQRVVQLLLVLEELSSDPNGDIELLPREDMAAIVGTSVETVSRIIAELKRRRLLYKVTQTLYRCEREPLLAIIEQGAE